MGHEKVKLNRGEYVFCSIDNLKKIDMSNVIATFKETEGHTLIILKNEAIKNNLSFYFISAWITLGIDSSLDSVGLTSAFSTKLAKAGISCNVVAAYNHDHIFVPYKKKDKVMKILCDMFESEK